MSRMHLIAYNPPKGMPPFEFTHDGRRYTMLPPDQYWRQVEEEYVVGDIIHQHSGTVLRQKKAKKKVWRPDPALTSRMKVRPNNTRWLSTSAYSAAKKATYAEFNKYLEDITEAQTRQQASLMDMTKSHEDSILQIQRGHEEHLAAMKLAYDTELLKKQSEMRDTVMEKALELGMTYEAFQKAVELAASQLQGDQAKITKAQKQLDKNTSA